MNVVNERPEPNKYEQYATSDPSIRNIPLDDQVIKFSVESLPIFGWNEMWIKCESTLD